MLSLLVCPHISIRTRVASATASHRQSWCHVTSTLLFLLSTSSCSSCKRFVTSLGSPTSTLCMDSPPTARTMLVLPPQCLPSCVITNLGCTQGISNVSTASHSNATSCTRNAGTCVSYSRTEDNDYKQWASAV